MLRAEGRQPLWTQDAMATEDAEHLIEIRVDRLAQLFHTLDPFPFREKDLDQDTEEYIVSWARELPDKRPVRIAVHIPDGDARAANSDELNEAFHHYFEGRAVAVQNDLNELFRIGRRSLAIGIPILVACFVAARFAAGYLLENPVQRLVEESLLILGWVANWRPLVDIPLRLVAAVAAARLVPAPVGRCGEAQPAGLYRRSFGPSNPDTAKACVAAVCGRLLALMVGLIIVAIFPWISVGFL